MWRSKRPCNCEYNWIVNFKLKWRHIHSKNLLNASLKNDLKCKLI